ncbi:hypothetical protein ABZ128_09415 [Streptomyces sp. NPDC006326]|uniref:hypothetical protein n=1 Tax=Streptomyces sp. NPDC006326 TaxID=3156752 RepID=UPI0033A8342A
MAEPNEVYRIRALFKYTYPNGAHSREEVRERLEYDKARVPRIVAGFKAFRRVESVEVERLTFTSEFVPELSHNVREA